jgi:peptidoglycan/xylan/chitin deacetylase (PgdA/CDA1 family)
MADAGRDVKPELFERVYDRHVFDGFKVRRKRDWWEIDVAANRDRVVAGTPKTEPIASSATICLCHDIERGLGHRTVEPAFAELADGEAPARLAVMLDAERDAGIRGTYNVVGALLPDVRMQIESAGHAVGFHTFDHDLQMHSRFWRLAIRGVGRFGSVPRGGAFARQLGRCRRIDRRIKGYRPGQSRLGSDTDPRSLAYYNFEWLASSTDSLRIREPEMDQGIVKIPILLDDFTMHRSESYDVWEQRALQVAQRNAFVAVSLHDCYGDLWLDRYPTFLRRLQELGEFKTLDEVAAEVTLAHAV